MTPCLNWLSRWRWTSHPRPGTMVRDANKCSRTQVHRSTSHTNSNFFHVNNLCVQYSSICEFYICINPAKYKNKTSYHQCSGVCVQYPCVWIQAFHISEQFSHLLTFTFYVMLLLTTVSVKPGRTCVVPSCFNSSGKLQLGNKTECKIHDTS